MPGVRFIEYKGKRILEIDVSNTNSDGFMPVIAEATKLVESQPPKSFYTLTIVTGIRFNNEVTETIKEFAAHNKPYVRAGAVVGVTGLIKIIYDAVMKFTGRNIPAFGSADEAKEWLATQP